ncbi:MAG TPA: hypothetical protein ENG87_03800, partial [Candidatus Pacearchaeota archaeon]|nr:hypothetical protein [Candidatus Pacearchaeota archaeon]
DKQIFKCPNCGDKFDKKKFIIFYECGKCQKNSKNNQNNFSTAIEADLFELMGLDLALVSPRHLFRMPYSLHEKTALASVVIDIEELENFELKDASPMKIKIKDFMPKAQEGEAKELVLQALDWYSINKPKEIREKITGKFADYKPIKLSNLSEANFPPCIKKILQGIDDGKKRSVFALINLFRSIGMERDELEKRIYDWNKKNKVALKEGYIKSQLSWTYRRKPVMPSNCREFYQGIGVCQPDDFCKLIKNPVNYVVRKNFQANKSAKKTKHKAK